MNELNRATGYDKLIISYIKPLLAEKGIKGEDGYYFLKIDDMFPLYEKVVSTLKNIGFNFMEAEMIWRDCLDMASLEYSNERVCDVCQGRNNTLIRCIECDINMCGDCNRSHKH